MTPNPDLTRTAPPDATVSRPDDPPTVTADLACPLRDLLTDSVKPTAAIPLTVDPPPGFMIEREIGVGGMGVVYLARQAGLNRPVALKLVRGGAAVDSKALIRFLAEAEAVAAVKHQNVVEVYQYGEHHGRPYLALEFCPGGDLTTLTKADQTRDAAWFRKVAELMATVSDGVQAAHAQGIVHRDLKPHNVFLSADGTPKVADFGLAKRGVGSDLTNTEAVMGTPAYMAPEQAGGGTKFVGPEADVWALGVMLYELCCGDRPIDTTGPILEALVRVAAGQVSPLRGKCPAVPPDLALIAHKCLSFDPRDRYPTASGLAADLRNWLDGKPISARPAGVVEQAVKWAKRNKKLAGMGVAVLLTMSVATGVSLGFGLEANRQADRANRKQADLEAAVEQLDRKAGELTAALGEKTSAEAKANAEEKAKRQAFDLASQLRESQRVQDLARLREAERAFDKNSVEIAHDKLAEIPPENRCVVWNYLNRRFQRGVFTLGGHTGSVTRAAYSLDGRRVVTASMDATARVWDATTGDCLHVLTGQESEITFAAISPDGAWVVTEGGNGKVWVWDARTGRSKIKLGCSGLTGVAFSRDGDQVMTMTTGNVRRFWDTATGEESRTSSEQIGGISGEVFSPDGNRLVSVSDNTAEVLEVGSGKTLARARGHGDRVVAAAFSPNGRQIATASQDGTARLWEAATGQPLSELKGHEGWVTTVAFSPDGRRLATGSADRTARVWDTATGQCVRVLKRHSSTVKCVAFSPDGRRLVTGSSDATGGVWDVTGEHDLVELVGHGSIVRSAAFSRDGKIVVSASWDSTCKVWDPSTGRALATLEGHLAGVRSVAVSPDGGWAVTGGEDDVARVWDLVTGRCLRTLSGHNRGLCSVAISPDGARVATGGEDGTARVWDAATGEQLLVLGESGWVAGVAFSPDGRRIATGNERGVARVWEVATGRAVLTLSGHTGGLTGVAFSPDGRRIATGSEDKTARVWDADTGRLVAEMKGHASKVLSLGYGPDGRRIVTGSADRTVRIWDAATGRALTEWTGHDGWVRCVTFEPDGGRLLTAGDDQRVRVWDLSSPLGVVELVGHTRRVRCTAFSRDGTRVATGSEDGTVRVWEAATGRTIAELPQRGVAAVAFSPDGARVATANEDSTAGVWEISTARRLLELKGHTGGLTGVAFSPDGRRIATGSEDKTARVWEADTGRSVFTLNGLPVEVTQVLPAVGGGGIATDPRGEGWNVSAVGFTRDGRRVVTWSDVSQASVWDADTGSPLPSETGEGAKAHEKLLAGDRVLVEQGDQVLVIDLRISEQERLRRINRARPDPSLHERAALEYKDDPFATAVQRSLEQAARGKLAVEVGDFEQALGHFLAAELLRPKPQKGSSPFENK